LKSPERENFPRRWNDADVFAEAEDRPQISIAKSLLQIELVFREIRDEFRELNDLIRLLILQGQDGGGA